jgi:hypothetical protein
MMSIWLSTGIPSHIFIIYLKFYKQKKPETINSNGYK